MNENITKYNGFVIRQNSSDKKTIDEVYIKKDYEKPYFRMSKKDVWADLGANIGAFSRLYAPQVKKIYAYEPSKDNYRLLLENTKEFSNVELINKAVSNKTGITEFYERPNLQWRNSTRKHFKDAVLNFLDCIDAKELPKDINSLKIDVEGSELEILETVDLTNINKLVMEWSFDFLPEFKYYNEAMAKLEKHFDVVKYRKFKGDVWQKNWFPPCWKIYAYNNEKITR